jgi:GT2 family glycosyltransferase
VSDPIFDIIIPVHDQAPWVDLCVRAVEHHTTLPYRIIVVDNASESPLTHRLLRELRDRGHTVIRLPENRSFSNALNAGVALGSAPNLIFLNDDAIVTAGWDAALLQDLQNKDIGLVGARSNFAAGLQGPGAQAGVEPPFIVFVCAALRRVVWDAVGPMDEDTFDGWSSEDLDYSWRVMKAGYRLRVSRAYVLHAGSQTLRATVGDDGARAANDRKYNLRLIDKWGQAWFDAHVRATPKMVVFSFHYGDYCMVAFKDAVLGLRYADMPFAFNSVTRLPIDYARRAAADFALDHGFEIIVMLDDDSAFPPDLLKRFLAHGKDVVTALAYQRKKPHGPCIYADGDDGQLLTTPILDAEHTGLRRVSRSGLHVAMIRTSVFQKMRDAGIRTYFGGWEGKVGEDMAFSLNCRKVGVNIYCDTDLVATHYGAPQAIDEAYVKAYRMATAPPPAGLLQPAQIDGHALVVER